MNGALRCLKPLVCYCLLLPESLLQQSYKERIYNDEQSDERSIAAGKSKETLQFVVEAHLS